MSAAERQRRRREKIKADRLLHSEYLMNERQRWKKRKDDGKTPPTVHSMNEREARRKRRYWRTAQEKCRMQRKAFQQQSPPGTPVAGSSQRQRGRKKVASVRSKCYKDLQKLTVKLRCMERKKEMYRKKLERVLAANSRTYEDTPRKHVRRMLSGCQVSDSVKRSLLLHSVTMKTIRRKYADSNEKNKRFIRNTFFTQSLSKYKLVHMLRTTIGVQLRQKDGHQKMTRQYRPKTLEMKEAVTAFLMRDDNSQLTTSKNDTISRGGVKRQRRLLVQSLKALYKKYLAEEPKKMHISYGLFCRWRPFNVVTPTARDRQSCLCKTHENARLMFLKLKQLGQLFYDTMDEYIDKGFVCDNPNDSCYLRQCTACTDKTVAISTSEEVVNWSQWETEKHEIRLHTGQCKNVRKLVKKAKEGTARELCEQFNNYFSKIFVGHVYRIRHQFAEYLKMKSGPDGHAVIICDFSENYGNKYSRAPQSTHFGASHQQSTLHTGVAYINGKEKVLSFATVSDSYRHDPAAIWCYMKPVFKWLLADQPQLTSIHVFSDGPSTQYKNKTNFFLTSYYKDILDCEIESLTWNYFESGHGKGAADAIGGTLKRIADDSVNKGADIPDAMSLYTLLQDSSKVRLFFVSDAEIHVVDELIPNTLAPVRGTASIHQVLSRGDGALKMRRLSCFCTDPCSCYQTLEVSFPAPVVRQQTTCVGMDTNTASTSEPIATSQLTTTTKGSVKKSVIKRSVVKAYPLSIIIILNAW